MKQGSYCKFDDPMMCFSCPYPDCIASGADINRQNAAAAKKDRAERNKKIVSMWNDGYAIEHLCAEFHLDKRYLLHILREERRKGVDVKL